MQAVYQKRHEKGLSGRPYVLDYKASSQCLYFFGASHSNDPEDKQWPALERAIEDFAGYPTSKKYLFYEKPGTYPAGISKEAALKEYSESGLAVWLARRFDIPSETGEPDRVEEIEYLKQKFSVPEIMTYYFGRQMLQWFTQDKRVNPDWKSYAHEAIGKYESLGCWDDTGFDLRTILTWFKQQTGKDFDPQDRQTLYVLSDPSQSVISSASGTFRDEHLFQKIQSKWQSGYDVFAVYGSGHAIVLEPALKELTRHGPI